MWKCCGVDDENKLVNFFVFGWVNVRKSSLTPEIHIEKKEFGNGISSYNYKR